MVCFGGRGRGSGRRRDGLRTPGREHRVRAARPRAARSKASQRPLLASARPPAGWARWVVGELSLRAFHVEPGDSVAPGIPPRALEPRYPGLSSGWRETRRSNQPTTTDRPTDRPTASLSLSPPSSISSIARSIWMDRLSRGWGVGRVVASASAGRVPSRSRIFGFRVHGLMHLYVSFWFILDHFAASSGYFTVDQAIFRSPRSSPARVLTGHFAFRVYTKSLRDLSQFDIK